MAFRLKKKASSIPNENKIDPIDLKDTYIDDPYDIELRDEHKNPIIP